MKLIINYDFFNAIKLLNTSESKLTLVKCKTKYWVKKQLPILSLLDLAFFWNDTKDFVSILLMQYIITIAYAGLDARYNGLDFSTQREYNDCHKKILKLSSQLQDLNIATNYELLLQSELYYQDTHVEFNGLIPDIVSKKYINIPAYDYCGDIKDVSVEQEHIIGTKEYVLTLGSPKSVHDLSFSTI